MAAKVSYNPEKMKNGSGMLVRLQIAKGVLKLLNDKEYPVGKSLFSQIHQYLVSVNNHS